MARVVVDLRVEMMEIRIVVVVLMWWPAVAVVTAGYGWAARVYQREKRER